MEGTREPNPLARQSPIISPRCPPQTFPDPIFSSTPDDSCSMVGLHSPLSFSNSSQTNRHRRAASQRLSIVDAFSLGKVRTLPLPWHRQHKHSQKQTTQHIMSSASAPASSNPATRSESSTKRRRASRACLACRARKVRCDVILCGKPCTNCRLDFSECVVQLRRKNRYDRGRRKGTICVFCFPDRH